MKPRKLILICKRFWPVSGETSLLAASFAEQLAKIVDSVDIVTWRMIRQWPDTFRFGCCRVIRLPQNHRTGWSPGVLGSYGRNRWHRSLHRWMMAEGHGYDGAIVFEFEGDSLVPSVVAGKAGIPIVSRVLQEHVVGASRGMVREAVASKTQPITFLTPDLRLMMDPLTSSEGLLQGTRYIADGFPGPDQFDLDKDQARSILARVHPIFQLAENALLAVCGSDLTFESGVFSLVRAWHQVSMEQPDARLWLIGTGRNAPELFQRICDLDLQNSVLLTGNFDDIGDVLSAADAYIVPGAAENPGWYSNLASQKGLTMIHHRDCTAMVSSSKSSHRIPFDDDSRPIDLVVNRWASAGRRSDEADRTNPPSQDPESEDRMTEMVNQYLEVLTSVSMPDSQQVVQDADWSGNRSRK